MEENTSIYKQANNSQGLYKHIAGKKLVFESISSTFKMAKMSGVSQLSSIGGRRWNRHDDSYEILSHTFLQSVTLTCSITLS